MATTASFGRYRVGAALGTGGMATVHEAWIEGPDGFARRVALKRIRGDAAQSELVRLFRDEARIASHLHHGNLVAIVDYGIEDGTPYQALELVEGTTLEGLRAELDRRGEKMPETIALHVVREVLHGLAYAHRALDENGKPLALVHRDVSPSNVLVGWNGDVKLSDFGIAFARGRQTQTAHGTARGKPSYMAPEQATRGTLDARTDLFGLGCTLHFALTGKSPLEGDEVLLKMLVGEHAALDAALPEDLRAIVAKAVSPERRDRFANADAMIEALDAAHRARGARDGRSELRAFLAPLAKSTRPAEATSTSAHTRPASTRGSRRSVVAVAALAVAVVVAVAFGLGSGARETAVTLPAADAGPDPVDAASSTVDAASSTVDAAPAPVDAGPRSPLPTTTSTRVAPPPPPPRPPTTTSTGSGWIRVVAGCDAARGGSVAIDGRDTGDHVPATVRASTGSHAVRVVAPDGTPFDGTVDVTSFHTEGSPAWFRACAE